MDVVVASSRAAPAPGSPGGRRACTRARASVTASPSAGAPTSRSRCRRASTRNAVTMIRLMPVEYSYTFPSGQCPASSARVTIDARWNGHPVIAATTPMSDSQRRRNTVCSTNARKRHQVGHHRDPEQRQRQRGPVHPAAKYRVFSPSGRGSVSRSWGRRGGRAAARGGDGGRRLRRELASDSAAGVRRPHTPRRAPPPTLPLPPSDRPPGRRPSRCQEPKGTGRALRGDVSDESASHRYRDGVVKPPGAAGGWGTPCRGEFRRRPQGEARRTPRTCLSRRRGVPRPPASPEAASAPPPHDAGDGPERGSAGDRRAKPGGRRGHV